MHVARGRGLPGRVRTQDHCPDLGARPAKTSPQKLQGGLQLPDMKRTEERPHSRASAPACLAIAADDDEKIHEFPSDPGAAAEAEDA